MSSENDIELFMKFSTLKKETHDKKFHNDIFRSVNFKKDEQGNLVCPNGKKFIKQDYNFRRITRVSLNKVNVEFYLVIIGFNLAKYHNRKYRLNYQPC